MGQRVWDASRTQPGAVVRALGLLTNRPVGVWSIWWMAEKHGDEAIHVFPRRVRTAGFT